MKAEIKERLEQIQRGEMPLGDKITKVGVIPEEWEVVRIEDCLERVGTPVTVEPMTHYTQIGIRSHGKGLFYKEPITGEEIGNKAVFWIEPDCFILNIVFAWEQAIGRTTKNERGMIGSHRFPMYRPIDGKVDIDYLVYYFLTKRGTEILEAASPGGAGRNRTLGQERFIKSKIALPPLEEQKKIVQILSEQDKVIELLDRKIEQLQQLKKYCLAKMFPRKGANVPEIRFPEFTDPWEQRKLGEVGKARSGVGFPDSEQGGTSGTPFFKVSDMNNAGNENEMNVANNYVTDSQIAARRWSPIEELPAVFFAKVGAAVMLNRKRLCRAPFLLDNNTMAYSLDKDLWDADFAKALFETIDLTSLVQVGALPSYNTGDVEAMKIMFPVVPEQQQIGAFFCHLDTLITLHQRKRDEEIKKKKALMQLLLTGIVRVHS